MGSRKWDCTLGTRTTETKSNSILIRWAVSNAKVGIAFRTNTLRLEMPPMFDSWRSEDDEPPAMRKKMCPRMQLRLRKLFVHTQFNRASRPLGSSRARGLSVSMLSSAKRKSVSRKISSTLRGRDGKIEPQVEGMLRTSKYSAPCVYVNSHHSLRWPPTESRPPQSRYS